MKKYKLKNELKKKLSHKLIKIKINKLRLIAIILETYILVNILNINFKFIFLINFFIREMFGY